jgi:hypothetical protein
MNNSYHRNIWCANDAVGAGNIPGACPRKENYEHKQKMKSSSSPSSDTCTGTTTVDGTQYNVTIYNCTDSAAASCDCDDDNLNECAQQCLTADGPGTEGNLYCDWNTDSRHGGLICSE